MGLSFGREDTPEAESFISGTCDEGLAIRAARKVKDSEGVPGECC
jgi:hypothetical protein